MFHVKHLFEILYFARFHFDLLEFFPSIRLENRVFLLVQTLQMKINSLNSSEKVAWLSLFLFVEMRQARQVRRVFRAGRVS